MIIGITGGIGGGKTTFSNLLRQMGYPVYDADLEAKRLQNENPTIRLQITDLFGASAYNEEGLDRKRIAEIVFNQPDKLLQINAIVHPAVKSDFINWMKQLPNERFYFIESAILFESHFDQIVDKIILVTASESIRIERVMQRDGLTREQVVQRIKNQIPEEHKVKSSHFVVYTDQNKELSLSLNEILKML